MKKMCSLAVLLVLAFALAFSPAVFAFSDIEGDPGKVSIQALKEAGLVSGMDESRFAPKGSLTYAQGVSLLVKAFHLNIDAMRFIKEPKASDYFTGIPDDAWYAESFMIAHLNGLPIPQDVNPSAHLTREEYADLLCNAMLTTGQYAFIEIFILIGDEDQISQDRMSSIQTLLIAKIAKLDENQKFRPKETVTRSQAAVWLYQALKFVEEQKKHNGGNSGNPDGPVSHESISVSTVKVTDDVNKIVLSRGEKPNAGYRITVDSIEFKEDGKALVRYRLHDPVPDQFYAQVITVAKTEVYVASQYSVVTEEIR